MSMGELRLLGEEPAGEPAARAAAALAAADLEGPLRELGQGRRGEAASSAKGQERAPKPGGRAGREDHGQATITRLAILKPKFVPGARLVKNNSVSFCLSSATSGFGLAMEAEQPEGAESSAIGSVSSNSKSMKYSGSATSSEK